MYTYGRVKLKCARLCQFFLPSGPDLTLTYHVRTGRCFSKTIILIFNDCQDAQKYGNKNPYAGIKTKKKGLARWFLEDWRNQRGEVGYKYKNDVYRPTRRITKKTPKTFKELSKKKIKKARTKKYRIGRVDRF